jgi:predicted phosphodiesterase
MRAIISDVHSNIEALQAVLADIRERGAEEILCLGDIVGYGPDPEECIDLIERTCRFCLSGNHDYAVLTRAERFNPLAEGLECGRGPDGALLRNETRLPFPRGSRNLRPG